MSAKTLNIREKPSLESAIWGVLQKNTKICEYWGVQNGFLQISRGWVAMDYLSSNPIPNPKIQEKLAFENKKIEAAIDKGRNQEYAQKVARYELREAFEHLIRGIQW